MEGEADDHVKIDLESLVLASSLRKSMPVNFSFSRKCCIFKIPNILRRHKPQAFMPNVFSIGPWNHGQGEHLKQAEEIKLYYLRCLISELPQRKLEELIQAIKDIEEDVRAQYAGLIEMSVDDFVKLLVIDGCFIIELFRKNSKQFLLDEYDPIFHVSCMIECLWHDLILLENQIPWSVLELLFNMTNNLTSESLEHLCIKFFKNIFTLAPPQLLNSYKGKKHILDLLREWLISSSNEEDNIEDEEDNIEDHLREWLVSYPEEGAADAAASIKASIVAVVASIKASIVAATASIKASIAAAAASIKASIVVATAFMKASIVSVASFIKASINVCLGRAPPQP